MPIVGDAVLPKEGEENVVKRHADKGRAVLRAENYVARVWDIFFRPSGAGENLPSNSSPTAGKV